eukprot:s442_g17.t1
MVVNPETMDDDALGAEYERKRLDKATCERLREAAHRCDSDTFQSLVSHGRPLLFEIACSPESRLSTCMQQMCGNPEKVRRFAYWNGFDLSKNAGVRAIMGHIERDRPLHVWLSLECGPFSPMQNINQRTEAQREDLKLKRAECMRQYIGGLLIYTFCHQLGIACTWEWSEKCNAWRLPMVQRVFNKIRPRFVVTKGCRVGLADPKTKLLLSKGWKLATTHELVGERMNMPCQGNHDHASCQGHLTRDSAYYTEAFVKRVCRAILDGISHQSLWSELRSTQEMSAVPVACSCEDVCHPCSELRCSKCEMEQYRSDPLCLVGEELVPFTDEEKEKHLKLLYQLHRNTGHGSMQNLVQALRAKNADPRIVELARNLKCSVCEESQRRTPRPQATIEPLPPKWKVVQADSGHWTHLVTKEQVQFLIMVDEGCRFRVGKIIKGGPSRGVPGAEIIQFFQEQWKPIFGKPDKFRVDPAGPCRSNELAAYLDSQGIELDIIPAEAHWQISHAERVIGSVKHVMSLLVREDPSITPEEAFSEALRVGNEKEVVRGYSPVQHALGRTPDTSGHLHVSDLDEVPPVLCENSEGEFHRNWERMKQAEQAFSEYVYLERLARAKNSRSYALKDFTPQDLVYVWRVQDKKGGKGPKKGAFTGPARVLAVETRKEEDGSLRPGSAVWIVRGSRLLKACPQQLRRASAREQCLEELTQPVDLPWTVTKLTDDIGKQEYEDVMDEVPDDMEYESGIDEEIGRPPMRVYGKRTVPECPMSRDSRRRIEARKAKRKQEEEENKQTEKMSEENDYAECFWSDGLAAVEVAFTVPDTKRGKVGMVSDLGAFMVSQLKRRAVEVSERHLDEDELRQMQEAKQIEVKKFIGAEALEVLPSHLQPPKSEAMRMRWVLTWKRSESGERSAKARCVILGYLDPNYAFRQTAAPTMSRTTRQLLLCLSSALGFKVHKGDVSGAFLQGREYKGVAYVIPTEEICESLGIPTNSVTKLRKACYGLVDAPLEWFLTVSDYLESLGFTRCVSDPCCFKYVLDNKLIGLISGHVDDFLFCGREDCETWKNLCKQIQQKFKWGTWESDVDGFTQCGVFIQRMSDGGFELSQKQYVDDLKEISISSERRKMMDDDTTEREKSKLRAALGALSWHAQQVGPHVSAAVSLLLSQVNCSKVRQMVEVNKVVYQVKANRKHSLRIHGGLRVEDMIVAGWADASGQNRIDGKSTQGMVIGITHRDLLRGSMCPVSLVCWQSAKIIRQCRSPGAAESLAAIDCEDLLYSVRLQLFEMQGGSVNVRRTATHVAQVPAVLVTDSTNVYDRLNNEVYVPKGPERRVALEMLGLKDAIRETGLTLRWVNSDAQLANSLTKDNEPQQLQRFYQLQQNWRIVEDPAMQSAKNRRKLGLGALEDGESLEPAGGHVSS